MLSTIRQFRARLDAGETLLGAGITLADPSATEALAPSVDFFWIDTEHTHLSRESVLAHLIAARAGGKPALVRVPTADMAHIKPLLDIGAGGIIVPQVRSGDEVKAVVDGCRYPPLGRRGFGPRRASNYGRTAGNSKFLKDANRDTFVVVQIETKEALDDLEAIVAIPGLDSIALGPYDLSLALGHSGDVTHPAVFGALQTIVRKARLAGKFVGTGLGASSELARQLIDMGVQWLQCGDDYGYMIESVDRLFDAIRGRPA